MANENDDARARQEADLRKVGLEPAPHPKTGEEDEDDEDDTDVDLGGNEEDDAGDDSEDDSDDSDDSEDDSDKDEDEDDEEDDSDKKNQSREKKIPVKVHNELRKNLREAQKKLDDALEENKKLASKLPDDFDERVAALAKELNIEDPEGLSKIAKLVRDASIGKVSELEKKLSDLEDTIKNEKKNAPIKDEFDKEWKTFEKTFKQEYPNATSEQVEKAQELMKKLSHTPNIGGKVYKDKDGRELIDPYELDYIFFKNKEKFSELSDGKKRKPMETTRTAKISEDRGRKDGDDDLKLPENPTPADLAKYQKVSSKMISDRDSLKVRPKLSI